MRRFAVIVAGMIAAATGCTRLTPAEQCEARGKMLAGDPDSNRCEPFDSHAGCQGDMECILGNDCVHEAKERILASRLNLGGWRLFDSAAEHQKRIAQAFEAIHRCRFGAAHFRGMKSDDGR